MTEPMNLSGGSSPTSPSGDSSPVSGAAPKTKIVPLEAEDQLSSDVQESQVGNVVQAFDVEVSKSIKAQSKTIANGEPFVIPPSTKSSEMEPAEVNELEQETEGNPWFQNVGIYISLFENIQKSSKQMSLMGWIESGYVIEALAAEMDLAEGISSRILSAAKEEALKHMLMAVGSALGTAAAVAPVANNISATKKADTEFSEKFGKQLPDGTWEGGKIPNWDNDVKPKLTAYDEAKTPHAAGETAPKVHESPEQAKLKQDYDDAQHEYDLKKQALDKARAEPQKWKSERTEDIMNQGWRSAFTLLNSQIVKLATDTYTSTVESIFAPIIATEQAAQETLRASQKINQQLMQSSQEQRTTSTREVNEMQQALRQILSSLRHTFGSFSTRKG